MLYFPHILDGGLAQFSSGCIRCPINILLDNGMCLYGDVNIQTKNDFVVKEESLFIYHHVFAIGLDSYFTFRVSGQLQTRLEQ